jgi:hypothetical protein
MQAMRTARAVRRANIEKKKEEREEIFSAENLPGYLLARFGDESEEGAWFEGQLSEETSNSEDSEEEEFELTDNEEPERFLRAFSISCWQMAEMKVLSTAPSFSISGDPSCPRFVDVLVTGV